MAIERTPEDHARMRAFLDEAGMRLAAADAEALVDEFARQSIYGLTVPEQQRLGAAYLSLRRHVALTPGERQFEADDMGGA